MAYKFPRWTSTVRAGVGQHYGCCAFAGLSDIAVATPSPAWPTYPLTLSDMYVNVNVTDTILWQGHHDRVMQFNWLYFCGIYQMMPLKVWPNTALGCNHQSISMPKLHPLCSAALVPNVLHQRDEGSGNVTLTVIILSCVWCIISTSLLSIVLMTSRYWIRRHLFNR